MGHELNARLLTTLQMFRRGTSDEDGQTLAEYGLIITVIAVGVVMIAVLTFRGALVGAFQAAIGCLDGSC